MSSRNVSSECVVSVCASSGANVSSGICLRNVSSVSARRQGPMCRQGMCLRNVSSVSVRRQVCRQGMCLRNVSSVSARRQGRLCRQGICLRNVSSVASCRQGPFVSPACSLPELAGECDNVSSESVVSVSCKVAPPFACALDILRRKYIALATKNESEAYEVL